MWDCVYGPASRFQDEVALPSACTQAALVMSLRCSSCQGPISLFGVKGEAFWTQIFQIYLPCQQLRTIYLHRSYYLKRPVNTVNQ